MGNLNDSLRESAGACSIRPRYVATAESCTGGWIAKAFTDIAGSSQWFVEGFVTYSNESKMRRLGVPRPCSKTAVPSAKPSFGPWRAALSARASAAGSRGDRHCGSRRRASRESPSEPSGWHGRCVAGVRFGSRCNCGIFAATASRCAARPCERRSPGYSRIDRRAEMDCNAIVFCALARR